ncbi:MAG: DUF4383 domain-containing protein [Pseudonocardia sp.]
MNPNEERSAGKDVTWGIRPTVAVNSVPKKFALVAGLAYVVGGVIGFFFTGFNNVTEATDEALLGIFHITPLHNVVHIGIGALWLLAAFVLTNVAAEGVNFAIAGFYVLAAVIGYLGYLEILGIRAGFDADNFLHIITGVVALLFAGLIPSRERTYA